MSTHRAKSKQGSRAPLGPRIDPVHLTEKSYGRLTVIFGAISVVLGVVSILGKFAEFFMAKALVPEEVKHIVISCVVVSISVSFVSAYLDSLHRLESLHASVELLTRQLDLHKFYYFDSRDERIAAVAMKRAAIEYVRYVGDLRRQIEHLDSSDVSSSAGIILKDWSLIAIFIRQIINTLGEPDCLAIWMGVSLVTNPDGWDAQNEVVFQFDNSIRHAVGEGILDRVYRVYYTEETDIDRGELGRAISASLHKQDYSRSASVQLRIVEPSFRLSGVQDVSFVWINDDVSAHKRGKLPDPSWSIERLRAEGWRAGLALEWVVRNNFLIDHVIIHSADEAWMGEHHRKMSLLWSKSESLPAHTPPEPPL